MPLGCRGLAARARHRQHPTGYKAGYRAEYKYQLSLEGFDVATNLGWMLTSDAVVLMPTPTVESWLGHGMLRPWGHYVPLDAPAEA